MYPLSKSNFLLEVFNFYNLVKISILHGHVFVMRSISSAVEWSGHYSEDNY